MKLARTALRAVGIATTVAVIAAFAASCSGGSSLPKECVARSGTCSTNAECGMGASCDFGFSPPGCVKTACVPGGVACSSGDQCISKKCVSATNGDASVGGDGGLPGKGVCSSSGDAGVKQNPCANKPNYVFADAADMFPNGFTIEACGSFSEVEMMTEMDGMRAAQFITPLAGAKIPNTPPYKFSWGMAMFMPPDIDAGDVDAGTMQVTNGVGYVVYFVDANTSKELLRVHTVQNQYTPDDPSWAKIVATNALQLKVIAASFTNDKITSGTKPVIHPQPRFVQVGM